MTINPTTEKPAAWTLYQGALHLARLIGALNPALMAALCPHLTPEEAVAAFAGGDGKEVRVACPPLRVRGAFHSVWYRKPRDGEPGEVTLISTHRVPGSYTTEEGRRSDAPSANPQAQAAVAFAEREWGEHLITDTWVAYVKSSLQNPTKLRARQGTDQEFAGVNAIKRQGFPITEGFLHIALARDVVAIAKDRTKPESVHYDEALIEATVDDFIGAELKGGRGGYTHFHCTICASPLGLTGCKGCGHAYGDDGYRSGGLEPLGPKLVAVVKASGLTTFPKDPAEAQAAELAQWQIYRQAATAREDAWTAQQNAS